jgi:hypothetical protein
MWSDMTAAGRPELEGIWQGVIAPAAAKGKPQLLTYSTLDHDEGKTSLDAGLDVRYAVSPTYTLVGSLNPDFKNIEQSIQSIAFSRSEQFLEDSRPFFAEGSEYLEGMTVRYGIGRLLYTRRIEDFDVGAKGYGRIDPSLGVGAFATVGAGGEANGAINLSKKVAAFTNVGLFGISHYNNGVEDHVFGLNFSQRFGNHGVLAELVQESGTGGATGAHSVATSYQIPRIYSEVRYTSVDPGFDPALGLIPFDDSRGAYWYTEYNDEYKNSWLRRGHAELYVSKFDRFDGSELEKGFDFQLIGLTARDQQLRLGTEQYMYEGERHQVVRIAGVIGASNRFATYSLIHQFGKRGAAPFKFWAAEASRRIFGKLDIGIGYFRQEFKSLEDQLIITAAWEFDAKRSIGGRFVQTNGRSNGYLAFRSSGFAGEEWFFILGDPNADEFRTRAALKFVKPF